MNTKELAKAKFFRMFNALEVIQSKENSSRYQNQPYDYLLVLDFEATCWEKDDPEKDFNFEIIEFPVVLYHVKTDKIVAEFRQYVKPEIRPILSNFCTNLTGITQNQVNGGIPLYKCLEIFDKWIDEQKRVFNMEFITRHTAGKKKCIFATWSNWDLKTCFNRECRKKHIDIQDMYTKWIDIRALYLKKYKMPSHGLEAALDHLQLKFEGRPHSGLDDARNTVRLVSKMIDQGLRLSPAY